MNSREASYAEGKRVNYSHYTGAITDSSLCAHKFVLVLDWSAGIAQALRCLNGKDTEKLTVFSKETEQSYLS